LAADAVHDLAALDAVPRAAPARGHDGVAQSRRLVLPRAGVAAAVRGPGPAAVRHRDRLAGRAAAPDVLRAGDLGRPDRVQLLARLPAPPAPPGRRGAI